MYTPPRKPVFALLLMGATLLIALNTWFAISSVRTVRANGFWLAHTWQVIGQIERVLVAAKDAESSTHSYIRTGDRAYLSSFEAARADLPRELHQLQVLTADNQAQQRRIADLSSSIGERISVLRNSIAAQQRPSSLDATQTELLNAGGRDQIARLSSICEALRREETRLLDRRYRATERSTWIAYFAIGLASLFDFILLLAIFRRLAQERDLRIAREIAAEQALIARGEAEESAEQVRLLNTELEERVRQRTAELETTNRELEAFSYSVSHDLRAPLRTIDGFSLALEEDYAEAVDATGRDYIRRVRAGVQRMGGLIDALLQLSRITRADLLREDVNLSALAETVAANLRDENPTCDLRFSIQPELTAHADPKLLQIALENLMGNAVKFSSKRAWSEIEIGWIPAEQAWFVRDNGAGFDMHYKEKLFNAFNRLHGDRDFKGSGIGLATVARVVHRHHGRIWAMGEVNAGATFWFTLG